MNIIKLQGEAEKRKGIYYEYDVDSIPLGEGGMGRVFKGFRVVERTGERKPVAIKAIYDNIPERVVERARREAEIQLENDNLIRMYGFVETTSYYEGGSKSKVHYHVIMELLVGVTLESLINGITSDQNGMQIPFAAELHTQYTQNRIVAVIQIMKSILSGVMALHDKGYIHRDIDPSNVMITIDRKIKLIDFGICKQIVSLESVDKALTTTGVFMGKVNYAAPELVLGDVKSQSYTTDIYALGVLLFQLYSGHLPFSGTDQDILSSNLHKPLPLKEIDRSDLKKVIRKATEKTQSKRYASVTEMRVDVERLSTKKTPNNQKSKMVGYIACATVLIVLLTIASLKVFIPKDNNQQTIVVQPTCEQLYDEALGLLKNKDDIKLQLQGKEKLKTLVEDSLFAPAKMKYYILLLNSNVPTEVKKGFGELEKIAKEDSTNSVAMFECGLTLSKANKSFNVPTIRQSFLGIEPQLGTANMWLYKAMKIDTSDYKSVYWAFNNLMEKKLEGTDDIGMDSRIIELYNMFEQRIAHHQDATSNIYRKAMESDTETLKAWGLIR